MHHIESKTYSFSYPDISYDINILSPGLELKRMQLMTQLTADCQKSLAHFHKNIDFNNILPRWIMLQFDQGTHFVDPVFPVHTTNDTQLEKDLVFFSKNKITPEIARSVSLEYLQLPRRCLECVTEIRAFILSGLHYQQHVYKTFIKDTFVRLTFDPTEFGGGTAGAGDGLGTRSFEIRTETYDKLARLLRSTHRLANTKIPSADTVNTYIFCLVARYHTLNSQNQQLAVLPALYSHLQKHHGVDFELMGSPLNCFFTHYCSLFGDIESAFGSHGNFNNIILRRGFFVINPPFDEEIMRSCTQKILHALDGSGELSVLFVVPVWEDPLYAPNPCTALLRASPHLSAIERVDKKRAKFFDHFLRRYIHPCDIYLILAQNELGKIAHPLNLGALATKFFPV